MLLAALAVGSVACRDDDAQPVFTVDTAGPATPLPVATPAAASTASTVPAATAPGYPAQPAGVPFPTSEWSRNSLPDGVDQAQLDKVVDAAMGVPGARSGVRSVVVVHGGSIVYERAHSSVGPRTVFSSFSVAKSFTSAIIGMLVADGLLALDAPVRRPEWAAGDPRAAITLRQLLQMSSGLEWTEEYGPDSLALRMLTSPDAAALMASQPLERPPGTEFEYSTGTSALIAGIAADAVGGCAQLDAYVQERLLDAIGISTEKITRDGGGCYVGGVGMDMTTRDFARFGLLYLRGGVWDGRHVVPTAWIDETREPAPTMAGYGLHWWLGPDTLAAVGLFGQRIVVVPEADLVVVINAAFDDEGALALGNEIVAAFGVAP